MNRLLAHTSKGIYCEQADVYIDPWRAVDKAFITHAHSDHARPGSGQYISSSISAPLIQHRLQTNKVTGIPFGEDIMVNGVKFTFYTAGHIIGSAQIRVEYKGEVWVVSGDYKTENDLFSGQFEPIKCNSFISECTFGLPVFNWRNQDEVFSEINTWWLQNKSNKKVSLISAYSLGKAQRVLSGLDEKIGKVYCHIAVENINKVLRDAGIPILTCQTLTDDISKKELEGTLIVAPPAFLNSNWLRKQKNVSVASASGWMNLRGTRRRIAVDKGFVLSDHADWSGLLDAIEGTGAEHVYVTHGYTHIFSRYLSSIGYDAHILETEYEGEAVDQEL